MQNRNLDFMILTMLALLPLGPVVASASAKAVRLDAIVSPTQSESLILEGALLNLKAIYRDTVELHLYYAIGKNETGYFSHRGEEDYREARRQALIRRLAPGKLERYLQARNSEIFNPAWEQAALCANLLPQQIEKTGVPENNLWQSDLAMLERHAITQTPAIIIDGQLFSRQGIGMYALDRELKRHFQPSSASAQAVCTLQLFFDPKALQPANAACKEKIQALFGGIDLKEMPITPDLETQLSAAGVRQLPLLVLDASFMESFYSKYLSYLTTAQPFRLGQGRYGLGVSRADTFLGRPLIPGRLDVYIQSHCPFAAKFLRHLLEEKQQGRLRYQLKFPRFIYLKAERTAWGDVGKELGFSSPHGAEELEEDARQLVIQKYYPKQYWDYLYALYAPAGGLNWSASLSKAGLPAGDINAKVKTESKALLQANYTAVKDMDIQSSPFVIVSNRFGISNRNKFFGFEADGDGDCDLGK